MNKIVVASTLAVSLFAGTASAALIFVNENVNWNQKTISNVSLSTGTATSFTYDIPDLITTVATQPSYKIDFSIAGPGTIVGATYLRTEWHVGTRNIANGSATSANPGGSFVFDLSSSTSSAVGTTAFGTDIITLAQSEALAGGSFIGGTPQLASPTLSLTETDLTFDAGWQIANVNNLFAFSTASDTFTSDGNSAASFINYSVFAIEARHVFQEDTTSVPEPASLALMGLGLGLLGFARKNKKS